MNELKRAIERVLEQQGCGNPNCKIGHTIAAVSDESMQHLREIYLAVKERL